VNGRNIVTKYDPPPIPTRKYDWTATFEDYDADYDGYMCAYYGDPIGEGATEQEAIDNLLDQVDE
jgi:hypothetical protein